jgi:ABC-2 type transport system ATP-binding protein
MIRVEKPLALSKHRRDAAGMTPPPADGPAIVVEGLAKRFGRVEALRGVDFAVPAGTVLGLLGPNGAGKTTAVRILTTILKPDAGSARVLGLDVTQHPQAVRDLLGLAGQYAAVDENLTGRENLRLVGRLTHQPKAGIRARADELLEQFDLTDASDRTVKTYSGGMRRRLDLAAALVHKPPILFLDEPTTGLDPRSRTDLWAVIQQLVQDGTTLLLTTQYLEEADVLADQIVVIDHGTVIAEGTAPELKARFGSTIVEIDVTDREFAAQVAGVLSMLGSAGIGDDGRQVLLTVEDGATVLFDVVRSLDRNDLQPEAIRVREPTLDDVFLSLTGHAAEEAPSDEPAPATGRRAKQRGAA